MKVKNRSTLDALKENLDYFEIGMKAQELFTDSDIKRRKEDEEEVKRRIRVQLEKLISNIESMQFEQCPDKLLIRTIKTQIRTTINVFL